MAIEDLLHPLADLYLGSPSWFKASAGRAYAWLPRRTRLGHAYQRFRDEIACFGDPVQTMRLARAKLRTALEWAIETVPAYQRCRSLRGRCDDPVRLLGMLPVTDRADIKRNPDRYVSRGVPRSQRLDAATGGSSLEPMCFFLHKHVTRAKEQAYIEHFRDRVGARAGDLTLALRGRAVPGAARPGGRLWTLEPIHRKLILSPTHLHERHMPAFAEVLLRVRPAFIEAFPSMLLPLARWLANHPLPEFCDAVRGIMLYSETVQEPHLALFRAVFRCPVLKHYGHSERVLMAASMPDDDRYFFWPLYGWFELLDFEDRPVRAPGVLGNIVGTAFDNRAMPFVRYRTGDLAVLSGSMHARLPGYPACERIEGRLQEFVVDRRRGLVSLSAIGAAHAVAFAQVDALQYEQERPGELVLKFVAAEGFAHAQQQRMAQAVETATGCSVRLAPVERIERTARGKHRMLVQKLDIASYLAGARDR